MHNSVSTTSPPAWCKKKKKCHKQKYHCGFIAKSRFLTACLHELQCSTSEVPSAYQAEQGFAAKVCTSTVHGGLFTAQKAPQ